VWRLVGDIRGEGAAILLRIWNALGWQVDGGPEGRVPQSTMVSSKPMKHYMNLKLLRRITRSH
jgi:hypothetical protein